MDRYLNIEDPLFKSNFSIVDTSNGEHGMLNGVISHYLYQASKEPGVYGLVVHESKRNKIDRLIRAGIGNAIFADHITNVSILKGPDTGNIMHAEIGCGEKQNSTFIVRDLSWLDNIPNYCIKCLSIFGFDEIDEHSVFNETSLGRLIAWNTHCTVFGDVNKGYMKVFNEKPSLVDWKHFNHEGPIENVRV